jgi:hypothetical protein
MVVSGMLSYLVIIIRLYSIRCTIEYVVMLMIHSMI